MATPEKCPRCGSPSPERHPAMAFEGEVQPCGHLWHTRRLAHESDGEYAKRLTSLQSMRDVQVRASGGAPLLVGLKTEYEAALEDELRRLRYIVPEQETLLRLADVAAVLAAAETDDDGLLVDPEQSGALLSALDHALRGDPGCIEPEEWEAGRQQALADHGPRLGLVTTDELESTDGT